MSQDNIIDVWNDVLSILKKEISEATFNSWIIPLEPQYFDETSFVLHTGQSFAPTILRSHYNQISDAIKQVLSKNVAVKIIFDAELEKQIAQKAKKRAAQYAKEEAEEKQKEKSVAEKYQYDSLTQMQSTNLNLKYKFENFVVGSNNNFAFKAAETVAKNPGTKYNPFYIYGGPGLGKTHLMQAIGHYIIKNNKENLKILYVTSEDFTNDVVNSIARGDNTNKKMSSFRKKYREADVLLIDDIQFIAGKERTQLEVFNTFNTLHGAGKQIVLTSDRPPSEISMLQERLSSRFESGLMADIQVPDIETRMAILLNLTKDCGVEVPNNVIEFVATIYSKNIRELEGAFNRITAYASINEVPLTLENVKSILNYKEKERTYTFETIVDAVSAYYNIPSKDVLGTSRVARTAEARRVAIYLCRDLTQQSYPEIGVFFDKKHTTILYSYEQVKAQLKADNSLAHTISAICEKLDK